MAGLGMTASRRLFHPLLKKRRGRLTLDPACSTVLAKKVGQRGLAKQAHRARVCTVLSKALTYAKLYFILSSAGMYEIQALRP